MKSILKEVTRDKVKETENREVFLETIKRADFKEVTREGALKRIILGFHTTMKIEAEVRLRKIPEKTTIGRRGGQARPSRSRRITRAKGTETNRTIKKWES